MFRLDHKYQKQTWENMFALMYDANQNISELYNLPVGLRRFLARKLEEVKQKESEAAENAKKGGPQQDGMSNMPDVVSPQAGGY